jgi:hypothetical protein
MTDNAGTESGAYRKIAGKLLAWTATTLAGLALALGGWAHGKLWAHDSAIVVLESKDSAKEKRLDKFDEKLDRILEEIRKIKP